MITGFLPGCTSHTTGQRGGAQTEVTVRSAGLLRSAIWEEGYQEEGSTRRNSVWLNTKLHVHK